nr:hypothetical protein [Tanacetum cinerariifolium]
MVDLLWRVQGRFLIEGEEIEVVYNDDQALVGSYVVEKKVLVGLKKPIKWVRTIECGEGDFRRADLQAMGCGGMVGFFFVVVFYDGGFGFLEGEKEIVVLFEVVCQSTHDNVLFFGDTSLNHEEDDLEIDEHQSDIIPIRRSTRTRHDPNHMCLYIDAEEHELGDLGEPANYNAVLLDLESDKWLNAMNVEMQSMKDNEVWDLVELPPNGKPIDYEETFSPVADIRAIRILIAIVAFYDYDIWQMDVKTFFRNGYLFEEVYMEQPEGFVNPKYPNRKILKRYHMENSKRGSILMQDKLRLSKSQGASTPAELKHMQNVPYASVVGSIVYAVRCTRPDIAFAQNITSRFQQNPGDLHWTTFKNIQKYLRNTKDMFFVYGGVVDWKSAKQSIFTTSSTEAEYIAAFDASKEAVWVRKFIYGLGVVPTIEEPIRNHIETYQIFADILKKFDKDDLVQLWDLVKERFSTTEPTNDKEKKLWVELKRLFESNVDDTLWKLQRISINKRAYGCNVGKQAVSRTIFRDGMAFVMHSMLLVSSSIPVSWLGSNTESVIAAMSGVWHRYCIRCRVTGAGLLVRMRVADADSLLQLSDSVKHYDYRWKFKKDYTNNLRYSLIFTK